MKTCATLSTGDSHMHAWIVIAAAAILLGGCSATGPTYKAAAEPVRDQALLYIFRPDAHAFVARSATFRIGGVDVAELRSGGYTQVYLKPGHYRVAHNWGAWAFDAPNLGRTLEIGIDIAPGETRYVELHSEVSTVGMMQRFRWVLRDVPKAQALAKIADCRYAPPVAGAVLPSPSTPPKSADRRTPGNASVTLDDLEGLLKDGK